MTQSEMEPGRFLALRLLPGQTCQRIECWTQLEVSPQPDTVLWMALNWRDPKAVQWLQAHSGVPENSALAVLSENTRPRVFIDEAGNTVLILRVVNAQAVTVEERLISLRLLISAERVISLCAFEPLALLAFQTEISTAHVARSPAELMIRLLGHVQEEIDEMVVSLSQQLEQVEEALEGAHPPLEALSQARKFASQLQRYLAPQRRVLGQLQQRPGFVGPDLQADWRELANALQLSLEEVEMTISRLLIIQDEIRSSIDEHTNHRLYLLSLVTFFFLPLSFITGFLGMNISFPWQDSSTAFWLLLALIGGILISQWLLIRRLGWL